MSKSLIVSNHLFAVGLLAFIPAIICAIIAVGISVWAVQNPAHPPIPIIERIHQTGDAHMAEIYTLPNKHYSTTLNREFHTHDSDSVRDGLVSDIQNAGGHIISRSTSKGSYHIFQVAVPEGYMPRLKALFDESTDYRDWFKHPYDSSKQFQSADLMVDIQISNYLYERQWLGVLNIILIMFFMLGGMISIGCWESYRSDTRRNSLS